jgi:glyoxylase-like metal-dependent hydrolase (beta-lactamase superfamily II)
MGRQLSALVGLLVLLAMMAAPLAAQAQTAQTAQAVLQAAAKAMGTNNLKCVTYTGAGYVGIVGQNHDIRDDWARVELANYTRTINYDARSSQEERVTRQGNYPARGGGGIPINGEQRQTQFVVDKVAWNVGANGMPAPAPAAAELRQLDIWLNPHGFLKGAMAPGANPVLITRWESGAVGGLSSTVQRRLNIISFMALGKYRINGTINDQNLVERVQTLVPNPVRGDMNQEGEYTQWRDVDGVKFPGNFHHHTDWDDETQPPNYNGGHNSLTFTVKDIKVNACANIPVPEAVAKATVPPVTVETTKLAEGVYYLTGGSHHSLAIEMRDHIVVVDTPQNEARAAAVLAKAKETIPNKPIRYVVTSHHHWDHLGGIRTAIDEGATIVTHQSNKSFLERVAKTPHTLGPDRLAASRKAVRIMTIGDRGQLTDGTRTIELHRLQNLEHTGDLLVVYLPKEGIIAEPDAFTPPAQPTGTLIAPAMPFAKALYDHIQRNKLNVQVIVPFHGNRKSDVGELGRLAGVNATN